VTTPVLYGFPPIVDANARTLILGNMPSVISLAAQQYYANPRNTFWRITGEIFGFAADDPYDVRTGALRANGVAVWDVLRSCRRAGSLDSSVERESMVANDFGTLFDGHRHIAHVFFNGAAAEKNFHRLVSVDRPISYARLPSTSPAQTMRFEDKLQAWRRASMAWPTRSLVGTRAPAGGAAPMAGPARSVRPTTTASLRQTACPPIGST
jgi:hypoxanthine-DNA glycosylase